MSCHRHAGDVVALHRLVDGVSVVDQEGDTLPVPPIRAQPDMNPVTEHHDVPRLPLLSIRQVAGQHLRMAAEEGIQGVDPAEVDIGVGGGDVRCV